LFTKNIQNKPRIIVKIG